MKTTTEQHDLIRWLDGEMGAAERAKFAARVEADAGLQAEAAALRQLGDQLRAHLPAEMPVPHADFFNSQVQVRIAQIEADDARTAGVGSWWSRVRLPSFSVGAAAAAAVIAAGLMIWNQEPPPADAAADGTSVLSTYTPDPTITPHAFHSHEADATVLMLDGLEELPEDFLLLAGGPN